MTADMNPPPEPDTDRDTATPEPATDTDAARMAGVSVRTVRRWIQHGHLPATETDRGNLVSPADLPEARKRAGRVHDRGHVQHPRGHDRRYDTMVTDADVAMTAPALSSATAQMEAIRDQWLMPLVDRIGELEREHGRLETERDQAVRERDALRAELAAVREVTPPPETATPETPTPTAESPDSPWRRVWRRLTGTT